MVLLVGGYVIWLLLIVTCGLYGFIYFICLLVVGCFAGTYDNWVGGLVVASEICFFPFECLGLWRVIWFPDLFFGLALIVL